MKIRQLLEQVYQKLSSVGIEDKAESEWLICLALNIKRSQINSDLEIDENQISKIDEIVQERKKHKPLSYILGSAEFYGYELFVDQNVLIPRPETEELVELAIPFISKESKVLDIGTGSGAIAIAIQKQTNSQVCAVDISQSALEVAKKNAEKHNAKIEFICSNVFQNLKGQKFDIIISNPPYITQDEFEELMPEVKNFEPKLALTCDDEGLEIYKKIIKDAPKHLNKNGKIMFEIGCNQASQICSLLKENFKEIVVKKDLQGLDRMVYATIKE